LASVALASLWFLDHNWVWPILAAGILLPALIVTLWNRPQEPSHWTEDMVEEDDPAKRRIICDVMNTGRMMCGSRDDAGNLFYERGVSGNKEVVPMNEPDRSFLGCAQGMTCRSIVLPSGLTLLPEAGKVWKVVNDRLVLIDEQDVS
jgi:hypothetical protein